jgi:hypothetical protein
MNQRLRPGGVSTKLIVILVVLAIIAAIVWGLKFAGGRAGPPDDDGQRWTLYCPECDKEFTFSTAEAQELPKQGEGADRVVQCPECKKFIAFWGGRPRGGRGVVGP